MHMLALFVLFFTIACSHKPYHANQATIIKQWHTSARVNTKDIQAAKKLPQYQNQKAIYNYLADLIVKTEHSLLLVEGCDVGTEIDDNFATSFNGWNMSSLKTAAARADYDDIVTALPLKLKAKFSAKVTALCADDKELMEKNQLALSDARAFIGFYTRLKESSSQPKKFARYKQALEEGQTAAIADPIGFSRVSTLKSLDAFESYVKQRNILFAQMFKKHIKQNPILIVGGLHAQDLAVQLKAMGIEAQIVTLDGYPIASETLADELRKVLAQP